MWSNVVMESSGFRGLAAVRRRGDRVRGGRWYAGEAWECKSLLFTRVILSMTLQIPIWRAGVGCKSFDHMGL